MRKNSASFMFGVIDCIFACNDFGERIISLLLVRDDEVWVGSINGESGGGVLFWLFWEFNAGKFRGKCEATDKPDDDEDGVGDGIIGRPIIKLDKWAGGILLPDMAVSLINSCLYLSIIKCCWAAAVIAASVSCKWWGSIETSLSGLVFIIPLRFPWLWWWWWWLVFKGDLDLERERGFVLKLLFLIRSCFKWLLPPWSRLWWWDFLLILLLLEDDLFVLFEFVLVFKLSWLDDFGLRGNEARPPKWALLCPLIDEEEAEEGEMSGACCIGGKKVEATAVVSVEELLDGGVLFIDDFDEGI